MGNTKSSKRSKSGKGWTISKSLDSDQGDTIKTAASVTRDTFETIVNPGIKTRFSSKFQGSDANIVIPKEFGLSSYELLLGVEIEYLPKGKDVIKESVPGASRKTQELVVSLSNELHINPNTFDDKLDVTIAFDRHVDNTVFGNDFPEERFVRTIKMNKKRKSKVRIRFYEEIIDKYFFGNENEFISWSGYDFARMLLNDKRTLSRMQIIHKFSADCTDDVDIIDEVKNHLKMFEYIKIKTRSFTANPKFFLNLKITFEVVLFKEQDLDKIYKNCYIRTI